MLTEISTNFANFATGIAALVGSGVVLRNYLKNKVNDGHDDPDEDSDTDPDMADLL